MGSVDAECTYNPVVCPETRIAVQCHTHLKRNSQSRFFGVEYGTARQVVDCMRTYIDIIRKVVLSFVSGIYGVGHTGPLGGITRAFQITG